MKVLAGEYIGLELSADLGVSFLFHSELLKVRYAAYMQSLDSLLVYALNNQGIFGLNRGNCY